MPGCQTKRQNKQNALRFSAPAVASILFSSYASCQVDALIVLIVLSNYCDNEYLLYDSVWDCGQASCLRKHFSGLSDSFDPAQDMYTYDLN